MLKLEKNKNIGAVILSALIILLLLILSNFLGVLNKSLQNTYYGLRHFFTTPVTSSQIILVEIDEEAFDSVGQFPFPRSAYARMLDNIFEYDIALTAFDILFLDPSIPEQDMALNESFQKYKRVVLGSSIDSQGNVLTPTQELNSQAYTTGFLPPKVESANKTVYSFYPQITDASGETYEHFTLQSLRMFYDYIFASDRYSQIGEYTNSSYGFSDTLSFPLAQSGSREMMIQFVPGESFIKTSFATLYDAEALHQFAQEHTLTDAIILVGPAADGLKDEFFTPNGQEYGMYVHANILNTVLTGAYLQYFNVYLEWILIFFLVILGVVVNLFSRVTSVILGNIFMIAVFWIIFPVSLLLGTNLILGHPAEIIFSLLFAFSGANIMRYAIENTNKKKLNEALSEYVSSDIAEEILSGQGKVNLDGERKQLVCFFSDIEGFTSLSERLSPEALVSFLREYLSEMTKSIMSQKGHIDKYEGDAIMGLWGAFEDWNNDYIVFALDSVLEQQKILVKLNQRKWKNLFGQDLKVRIGLHAGEAIVGNIGAKGQKMEFTALGDNVNLASRLEGVNKFYGTYMCVSESIYEHAKDEYFFRFLDSIQVKGKDIPVKIYELIGRKEDISETEKAVYDKFDQAMSLYQKHEFMQAKELFEHLAGFGDAPSQTFFKRCEYLEENPPKQDWDSVWRMTEK